MRLIFAGTPEFARVALQALHEAGHEIALVLCQPDRPAGRGLKLQACPVKQYALDHGMPVCQPHSLRLDGKYPDEARSAQETIEHAQADAMVVAAYGLLLPQWVLDAMEAPKTDGHRRWGCLNIHGSLLPRWRGAAPIHRAIEAGDAQTGITIMQMDIGLDTGDMLLAESVPITPADTTASLHDTLATLGGRMVVQALAQPQALRRIAQPADGVCYAHKIDKAEAPIRWTDGADAIARRVRAFNPFPAATVVCAGETLKVWAAFAKADTVDTPVGTVLSVSDAGIEVAAGSGRVVLTELQRAGGKRLSVADFLRGFAIEAGAVLH
ncbi:methionyl-tRNA formyltransferase [Curvibacter sp. CHRR-16]|uniref:methionyl-tRNA formyltransferase n=1 Tax=Curvibacter sp. CHRR-16 TaxID=2835872 RepID=UPI001BDAFD80|nr:methionyl-tRNA formyltransferase [Curvibacter sp. CHRR-16]